jgi:hypothetical protein
LHVLQFTSTVLGFIVPPSSFTGAGPIPLFRDFPFSNLQQLN